MMQSSSNAVLIIIPLVINLIIWLWTNSLIKRRITNKTLRKGKRKEISKDLAWLTTGLTILLALAFTTEKTDTVSFIGKVISLIVGLLATIKLIIDVSELLRDGNSNLN